ncbi:MAG: hypothetical protein ACI9BD_001100 [Candidatus Marinamargulisbacteria bacterium]|jgi:hypothetical protein
MKKKLEKVRKEIEVRIKDEEKGELTIRGVKDKLKKLERYLEKVDSRILRFEELIENEVTVSKEEQVLVEKGLKLLKQKSGKIKNGSNQKVKKEA